MPARLTLHLPERASTFRILNDGDTITIGRDPQNDVVIDDPRVSKRHSRLSGDPDGWTVDDLGSKNGTIVNGVSESHTVLRDGDWISFGGVLGQFELMTPQQVEGLEAERSRRRRTSADLVRRLTADLEPRELLLRLMASSMDVTGAERGFVLLLRADGTLQAQVAAGFSKSDVHERFSGSLGAIERVLATEASVVVSDVQANSFLGKRPSVVEAGLRTLACVPLRHDSRIVGFLYVDGRRVGAPFTELDVEILEALAEQASIVIASLRLDQEIRELFRGPSGASTAEGREILSELQRRVEEVVRKGGPRDPGTSPRATA